MHHISQLLMHSTSSICHLLRGDLKFVVLSPHTIVKCKRFDRCGSIYLSMLGRNYGIDVWAHSKLHTKTIIVEFFRELVLSRVVFSWVEKFISF